MKSWEVICTFDGGVLAALLAFSNSDLRASTDGSDRFRPTLFWPIPLQANAISGQFGLSRLTSVETRPVFVCCVVCVVLCCVVCCVCVVLCCVVCVVLCCVVLCCVVLCCVVLCCVVLCCVVLCCVVLCCVVCCVVLCCVVLCCVVLWCVVLCCVVLCLCCVVVGVCWVCWCVCVQVFFFGRDETDKSTPQITTSGRNHIAPSTPGAVLPRRDSAKLRAAVHANKPLQRWSHAARTLG